MSQNLYEFYSQQNIFSMNSEQAGQWIPTSDNDCCHTVPIKDNLQDFQRKKVWGGVGADLDLSMNTCLL